MTYQIELNPQVANELLRYGKAYRSTKDRSMPCHGHRSWIYLDESHLRLAGIVTKTLAVSLVAVLAVSCPVAAVSPESLEHTRKGIAAYNQGKTAEALIEFRKAVDLDPKNADYHRNISLVYDAAGKGGEATKHAELACKFKPGDARNQAHLAGLKLKQGKFAEAEAGYRQAVKLAPKNSEYKGNLLLCLMNGNKLAEAEKEAKSLLQAKSNDVTALCCLCRVALERKNTEEAEKQGRLAVKAGPDNPDAHFALANVLKKRGKDKEAIKEYQKVLALNSSHPSNSEIKDAIKYLSGKVDPRIP